MTEPWRGWPAGAIGHVRASAADRDHVIDLLKSAFAEGRVTRDELDERAGHVYESRTYADLAALTADLPAWPPGGPVPQQPGHPPASPQPQLNPLAVAALVCALIPGVSAGLSVVVGLMARRQISETGERGAATATAAIVIGSVMLTAFLIFLVAAAGQA